MMFMATMIIAMKIAMVITMMMMTMMRNLMRESFLMMRRNWMVWDFMVSEKLLKQFMITAIMQTITGLAANSI